MNSEIASGTTNGAVGPIWSSTCERTCSTTVSHTSWRRLGTPLVTLRRSRRPRPMTTAAASTDDQIVSRLKTKPPMLTVT